MISDFIRYYVIIPLVSFRYICRISPLQHWSSLCALRNVLRGMQSSFALVLMVSTPAVACTRYRMSIRRAGLLIRRFMVEDVCSVGLQVWISQ